MPECDKPIILVTGATGYVGGRLVGRLVERGARIRCMARSPERLAGRVNPAVDVVPGDVTKPASLESALAGVDTAYYLIHSLASRGDLESTELAGARNFADAARAAGVRRMIYLGGLGDARAASDSAHMRSRHAVGEVLRESGVPTIEFRASIIIGSGSLSFELIRSLVRRLPVMVVPRWVRVKAQPIAIDDVLDYLVEALDIPLDGSRVYEIGGKERLSYLDLMKRYGEITGLNRVYINVPVLTPKLSSLWLHLVTPIFSKVGRKLIDSITVASVVQDDSAAHDFSVRPMDVTQAIHQALDEEDRKLTETHWSDALSAAPAPERYGGRRVGSRIVDSRVASVSAPPERAFEVIEAIGGQNGWYYGNWLWSLRGLMDRMVGGVGMARGRRDPARCRPGDVIDCWRVEAVEPPHRLLLRAEMKVFGRAWLQFEVKGNDGGSEIRQTAIYDPRGLSGIAYWYSLYPIHEFVFRGMLRNIARTVEKPHHHRSARTSKQRARPPEE